MNAKEAQLTELLSLTARSLTHLTAAITSLSFDLLRSEDVVVRGAGMRMINRMAAINGELDQQWQIIGELTGITREPLETMVEVQMGEVPVASSS